MKYLPKKIRFRLATKDNAEFVFLSVIGQFGGLDKQDTRSSQNAPMVIFDENQVSSFVALAPKIEP